MSDPTHCPSPVTRVPPIVLAPLQGVTTALFRRVFQRHFSGVDRAMAPFIPTTTGRLPPLKYFRDVLPENNRDSLPLIPQLIGKDGHDFREAANFIHDELGYPEINWNIGCPSPTVTARGRGAGLLRNPEGIESFLEAACAGLRCRLSVKMRLGMERDDDYLALIDLLNRYPIAEITIHPRTGRQQYEGRADRERFADLKSRLRHPVAYNGDIVDAADGRAICDRFPDLSSLMIGRGAITNPGLPAAIRVGTPEAEACGVPALARFHDDLYDAYRGALEGGAGPVLAKMKEVWNYWAAVLPEVRRVLKSRTLPEYEENVARALGGGTPGTGARMTRRVG
jgi:tRNA-dihydrouridine synthase